jgi:hypothetical protein
MLKQILSKEEYIANIKFLHRLEQLKEKYQNNENLVERIIKVAEMRVFRTRFGQQLALMDDFKIETSRWKGNYPDPNLGFKIADGYLPIIDHIMQI